MVRTADPKKLEKFVQDQFKASRIPQSEWFNLCEKDLDLACIYLTHGHEEDNYVVLPFEAESRMRETSDLIELINQVNALKLENKKLRAELEQAVQSTVK